MPTAPQSFIYVLMHRVERMMLGPMRSDVRHNVWIETFASAIYGIFWAVTVGFMPVVLRKMGASASELAIYVVFQSLGLIFTPFSAMLFQRFRIIKIANGIWAVGRSMFLLVPLVAGNIPLFMVLLGIFWVCEVMPAPGYVRLLERMYPNDIRGRIMGFIRIGMTFTILCMTPVAGWLLDHYSYTILLPCFGVVGLAASAMFQRLKTDDSPVLVAPGVVRPSFFTMLREIAKNRSFMMFLFLNTLFGCGTLLGAPLYAIVQVNRLQLSYTQVGYLGLIQSITWLIGYFFWGTMVDRRGPLWVLVISMLCGALMPFGFMFATSIWWLVPAFIGQGLLMGGFDLGFTTTAMALADRKRLEIYFSVVHLVSGVRGIVIPLLTPLLIVANVSEIVIFGVGGFCILASAVLAFWIRIPATLPEIELP